MHVKYDEKHVTPMLHSLYLTISLFSIYFQIYLHPKQSFQSGGIDCDDV